MNNILGLERPVEFTGFDMFDPQMAQMVLGSLQQYINAAKDQYTQNKEDLEKFYKQYGDFYSPIAKDTAFYYDNTIGAAADIYNAAEKMGIDPLKDPQMMSYIRSRIAKIPYAELAERKLAAENAKEYLKNKAKLELEGKWNPEYEKQILGGKTLETWDTDTDGIWNRLSPAEYSNLFDATNKWFEGMKDSYLGTTPDGYMKIGVSEDQMRPILNNMLGGFLDTDLGKFYYNQAKSQLDPNATNNQIVDRLRQNILDINKRVEHVTREEDPFVMESIRHKNKLSEMAKEHEYKMNENAAKNGDKNQSHSMLYTTWKDSLNNIALSGDGGYVAQNIKSTGDPSKDIVNIQKEKINTYKGNKKYGGLNYNSQVGTFLIDNFGGQQNMNDLYAIIGFKPYEFTQNEGDSQKTRNQTNRKSQTTRGTVKAITYDENRDRYNLYTFRGIAYNTDGMGNVAQNSNVSIQNIIDAEGRKPDNFTPVTGHGSMISTFDANGNLNQYRKVKLTWVLAETDDRGRNKTRSKYVYYKTTNNGENGQNYQRAIDQNWLVLNNQSAKSQAGRFDSEGQ